MSSSIDQVECPECGVFSQKETDHKTGESWIFCPECGYESDKE